MIKTFIKIVLLIPLMVTIKGFASGSQAGYVEHNYQDHSNDPISPREVNEKALETFPEKLFRLLSYVEENDFDDVVSWLPHGRSFMVHDDEEFLKIAGLFFSQTKISSFKRQLNLYSFNRLTKGLDSGSYYHELFLRGRPDLLSKMKRLKLKGNHRLKSNPQKEPNFYEMFWSVIPMKLNVDYTNNPSIFLQDLDLNVHECDENSGLDFFVKEIEKDFTGNNNSENTPY